MLERGRERERETVRETVREREREIEGDRGEIARVLNAVRRTYFGATRAL